MFGKKHKPTFQKWVTENAYKMMDADWNVARPFRNILLLSNGLWDAKVYIKDERVKDNNGDVMDSIMGSITVPTLYRRYDDTEFYLSLPFSDDHVRIIWRGVYFNALLESNSKANQVADLIENTIRKVIYDRQTQFISETGKYISLAIPGGIAKEDLK